MNKFGVTLLASILLGMMFVPDLQAGGPRSALGTTPRAYAANRFPLTYRYDRGGLGAFTNAAARAITDYAFTQWSSVAGAALSFTNGGQLARDVTTATDTYISGTGQYSDGINPIVFDSSGSITDDRLGAGAKNSVLGFAGSAYFTTSAAYAEGFVIINGGLTGTGGTTEREKYEATITHEVGHFLGLSHSQIGLYAKYPTMYPSIVDAPGQRTLDADDQAAIAVLYPRSTFRASIGKITGTVKKGSGTNLSGVNVIAIDSATNQTYSTVVDYLSGGALGFDNPPAKTGAYTLDGLPPGNYFLKIEPINSNFTGGSSVASYSTPQNTSIPSEWYNAGSESGNMLADNSNQRFGVRVAAGGTASGIAFTENESSTTSTLNEHNGTPWGVLSLPSGSVTKYAVRYTAPTTGSIVAVKLRIDRNSVLPATGSLTVSLHTNQTGSLAGIPGTQLGAVTIPYTALSADVENVIYLRGLGTSANFTSGTQFHVAFTADGGTLRLPIDNGSGTRNQSSYFNGTWRNIDDGYNAGYNLIVTAIYSSESVGGGQPGIAVTPAALDFGRVRIGANTSKSLTVTNTGTATLNVTATSITGPQQRQYSIVSGGGSFSLAPNATRQIGVRFAPTTDSTDEESETRSATLSITSNAPNAPTNVPLVGTATKSGARRLIDTINFGSRRIGGTYLIDTFVVMNPCNDTLRISSATLMGQDAGGAIKLLCGGPVGIVAPDSSFRVRVQFTPTERRTYLATLRILHDDLSIPGGVTDIQIVGTGIAPIADVPASFNVGQANVGASIEGTFTLGNGGDAALRIQSLTLSGANASEFAVVAPAGGTTVGAGSTMPVRIRFTPAARGRRVAVLTITTDAGTVTTLLEGTGLQGELSVALPSLDFGQVNVGTTLTKSVRITNIGTSTATISGATATGPFSVVGSVVGTSLAPGQAVDVQVRFAPTAQGTFSGTLSITSNGRVSPVTVGLTGQGVSPGLSVDQQVIDYGIVQIGGKYYRLLVVRNTGQVLLQEINLTLSGSPYYAVTGDSRFALQPGEEKVVEIELAPGEETGAYDATLNISADGGVSAEVPLKAVGFATIVSVPGIVDFGQMVGSEPVDTVIALRNDGPIPLRIDSVSATGTVGELEGAYFQLPMPLPVIVQPGESIAIPIRFVPNDGIGSYSGTMTFFTDSPVDTTIVLSFFANVLEDEATGVGSSYVAGGFAAALYPPVPNPARDEAEIRYRISGTGTFPVYIVVVDILGRVRAALPYREVAGNGSSGEGHAILDLTGLPAGEYQVVLKAADRMLATRLVIVR